jgi:NAD(P)H-flavin reductase
MLDPANRSKYGKIFALYGARSPGELLYKKQLAAWKSAQSAQNLSLHLAVDKDPGEPWDGKIGLVPNVLRELKPSAAGAIALVCGPPIMIRFTIPALQELGFAKEDIILSLENRMKCGIGKCGRCNVGAKYVCVDGPVFSFAELEKLPPEY